MKAEKKRRCGKLVAYLLDPQGKKTRVGEVSITNCVSSDTTWAVREITATQRLNARAISDRTYHLLVSLRAGENPDAQTLRVIEERFCKELGYAEHQRIAWSTTIRTTCTSTLPSIRLTKRLLRSQ